MSPPPRADEQWPVGLLAQMLDQRAADACALLRGARIRMPDQRHVAHLLQPHHAGKPPAAPIAPETTRRHFLVHLFEPHIGVFPAVRGNDVAVGNRGVVTTRQISSASATSRA